MALRGAVGRDFNLLYALLVFGALSLIEYAVFKLGGVGTKEVVVTALAFVVGLIAGSPAGLMNRRALQELYGKLDGKFYLSSQLALLDSREGKNAFAYFYFIFCLAVAGNAVFPWLPDYVFAPSAVGAYYSAHLFPFLFAVKAKGGACVKE